MVLPSGATLLQQNIMRGWAAQLQINSGEIKQGKKGFRSNEQTLQGGCNVLYTVSDSMLRKTTSILDDCPNRVFRKIDDYRGLFCNKDLRPNYPTSLATTIFDLEKKSSGKYQINGIVSTGSFIAQFFEEEGSAQFVFTNQTSK